MFLKSRLIDTGVFSKCQESGRSCYNADDITHSVRDKDPRLPTDNTIKVNIEKIHQAEVEVCHDNHFIQIQLGF